MNAAAEVPAGPIRRLLSIGVINDASRLAYGGAKTLKDSVLARRLVVTKWSPREQRWHYSWPQGKARSEGRWADALGWATRGFYYGMDDLLWRDYRPKLGDVVLDIGAGDGGETFYLASMVGPKGRVVSVEAAPGPFAALDELVHINGWAQVTPVHSAISDQPGVLRISESGDWVAFNVFESTDGVEVPAETIDDLCARLGITHVDWLKMNIEGAERQALLGMEKMAPHIDHVTISCHDFLKTEWGTTLDEVLAWLRSHGFRAWQRNEGDFVQALYVYGSREALES